MEKERRKVVIAGGGTAGWLTACALSTRLRSLLDIRLVESDAIGTIGVGEATVPPIRSFHKLLDIDEVDFMRATQATFKLGIEFEHWGGLDRRYIHAFGMLGKRTWLAEFHEFWLEAKSQGFGGNIKEYSLEGMAAKANKFARESDGQPLNYAYHLDATAYAAFLRKRSEAAGVRRIEGKISTVQTCSERGHIEALVLENGERIEGDLFIDCTGFRSLLLGEALGVPFEDWGHWLKSDRAVAVQTKSVAPALPYTRAIAHEAGWQWQIPLQHRVGNGLVYCSDYLSDEEAQNTLLVNLSGELVTEPKLLRFRTGCRRQVWHKNCVAIGLSSGFLEPLESTSIHLVTTALIRLMRLFPFADNYDDLAQRYNYETNIEIDATRDFIILHYKQTERNDSDFWNDYRTMNIPDRLVQRLDTFKSSAYIWPDRAGLFIVDSWLQVMMGQGLEPQAHHGAGRITSPEHLQQTLTQMTSNISRQIKGMSAHEDFVRQYCSSNVVN